MFSEVIKLVSQTKTVNDYGDIEITEKEKTVFASLKSISQSEFYQAQAVGLRPEVKFILAEWLDYGGEKVVRYTPFGSQTELEFSVIRTFRTGDALELVCKRGVDE